MIVDTMVGNPYLDEYLAVFGEEHHGEWKRYLELSKKDMDFSLNGEGRTGLRHRYAFAVPTEEAIQVIAALSPIVEIGAGSGYWASLIARAGAEVVAYDDRSWDAEFTKYWCPVRNGGPEKLDEHPGWTLFLCWPPYDTPMAHECLLRHTGRHVVYVGEECGGCTGDEAFHAMLDRAYDETWTIALLQWPGIHDDLKLYEKKIL